MDSRAPAGSPGRGCRRTAAILVLPALPPGEPTDLDEIAERSGLSAASLLPRLFDLELQARARASAAAVSCGLDRIV